MDSPQKLLKRKPLVPPPPHPPPPAPGTWAAAGRPKRPTQHSEPRGGDSVASSKGDLAGVVWLGPVQQ